jgi:hypothetical protein
VRYHTFFQLLKIGIYGFGFSLGTTSVRLDGGRICSRHISLCHSKNKKRKKVGCFENNSVLRLFITLMQMHLAFDFDALPAAFQIRIHRIHMHLSLLDPDPDPLVGGMDPDPSIIFLSSSKNSKQILDSNCFMTSFELFIFENDVNVPSTSNYQKKVNFRNILRYFFVLSLFIVEA